MISGHFSPSGVIVKTAPHNVSPDIEYISTVSIALIFGYQDVPWCR
jgi:hypothetical protein